MMAYIINSLKKLKMGQVSQEDENVADFSNKTFCIIILFCAVVMAVDVFLVFKFFDFIRILEM